MVRVLIIIFLISATRYCIAQKLPIIPARTISFDTEEASYMDVDLSPDGKIIVFDILGNIYTVPVSGGKATQLTRGLACNRRPTWSPDGKYIAFISDRSGARHLTIMNNDGSSQRTLVTTEKQISPSHVVKTIGEEQSMAPLWVLKSSFISVGRDFYQFNDGKLSLSIEDNKDIQFSPDGRIVYFRNAKGMHKQYINSGSDSLIASLPKYCVNVQLTKDGRWLTYIAWTHAENELRVRNLLSGEDRQLAASIEKHRVFSEHYVVTPDSKAVIIGFGGKLHSIDLITGSDRIIPFKAHVNEDLGALDYHTFRVTQDSFQVAYIRSANTSPDGKHLVFSALDRVYTVELPDGKPEILVQQSDGQFQPSYSPDGKWIVYITWNDREGGFVWRVHSYGGKPEKLTPVSGYYQHLTWSPDGSLIAATWQDPKQVLKLGPYLPGRLLLIPANGGQSKMIADSIPGDNELSFAEDGKRVVFMQNARHADQNKNLVGQLYSVQLDGDNEQLLAIATTKYAAYDYNALSQLELVSLSPDGRYIMYKKPNDDLYLAQASGLDQPIPLLDYQQILPVIRFARGGVDPHWENGGETICWCYGNQFYRIKTAKILNHIDSITTPAPDQTVVISLKAPSGHSEGTIALCNVRILTMHGDEVIEHGTVVIKNSRFADVGTKDKIKIPPGAKVYDMTNKTVIPGLIDLHDHMHVENQVFPQQSWKYLVNLAYGVTTARDPATDYQSFGYTELLRTGQMIGPRLFSVGYPVINGDIDLQSPDDARQVVRERKLMGAVAIKQYTQETRMQKEWLLMASDEAGLNMTNEGGTLGWLPVVEMIKDGSTGIEHNDWDTWGNVYKDVITFLSRSGTWLTPTLLVGSPDGFPYFENYYRQHPDLKLSRFWPDEEQERIRKEPPPTDSTHLDFVDVSKIDADFRHHGMKVTMGSHGNLPGIGSQFELWALQMGGLTNMEALQAATIDGAEGLGMQQDLGSIEVGKIADLIVLNKNPLDDIHNTGEIKYVMKEGILYDGDTLDELWPEKKKCPVAIGLKGSITDSGSKK